jgi:hypothetical protein
MRLRFGELPEDHIFLYLVRPFVENCFKLITWLIVIATLQVAADLTGSRSGPQRSFRECKETGNGL